MNRSVMYLHSQECIDPTIRCSRGSRSRADRTYVSAIRCTANDAEPVSPRRPTNTVALPRPGAADADDLDRVRR